MRHRHYQISTEAIHPPPQECTENGVSVAQLLCHLLPRQESVRHLRQLRLLQLWLWAH